MKLFNTLSEQYIDFNPPKTVKIYVCGITPYSSAHLGHIFTFMTYDLLQRRLEDNGHEVKMVRNITDVDEPLYVKAQELNISYMDLANKEIAVFDKTLNELNFRKIYAEPRASQYIDKMIQAIEDISNQGYSYTLNKDVYFDANKTSAFGMLSRCDLSLKLKILKNRGGNPELKDKHNPLDFLLWKGITDSNDPAQWTSSFGWGRPGWHIECSVMSRELLGEKFDLHGGGADLIFPHHESEIAQSMALNGESPTDTWMHVYPLLLNAEKMSKSLGNLIFAHEILQDYRPAVLKLALMNYHYRIGGEWQQSFLDIANKLYDNLLDAISHCSEENINRLLEEARQALDDDLNTPAILLAIERFINRSAKSPASPTPSRNLDVALDLIGLINR